MNSVEILERKAALKDEAKTLIENARVEIRTLTDEENNRFNEIKQELETLNEELRKLETVVEIPVENKTENNKSSINRKSTMNKNFSLLGSIRSVVENKQQSLENQAVIDNGILESRAAGINYTGQIQIPMSEEFRTVTVATEHDDAVQVNLMNVLEPLRAKSTLLQSGVKFLSNLKGDVQYPLMSAVNATWLGETASVSDSTPLFSSVTLSPKRLSCRIPVSKQFLIQDSISAEQALRDEIINAISNKLEATILGSAAGSTTQPQGLFYSATTLPTVDGFEDLCDMEGDIETANMEGYRYICSPKAKAALRGMAKGENIATSVYDNGEIDGTACLTTSNIANKGIVVADWSQMVLGQFGSLDVTVDPYTGAASGIIYLTVSAFFDFKVLRDGCYKVANIA